jgi:hypothetical protein
MTGHKTRAVFERYYIASQGDLDRAADQLEAHLVAERARLTDGDSLGTVTMLPATAHR